MPSWPIKGWSSRRHIEITCGYLVAYVALDWLSYVHPFDAFGITPWSPPTGLSFALIIVFGREYLPWLFVAPVLADAVVRGLPLPLSAELATSLILGGGYSIATCLLLLPRHRFDPTLATRSSLLLLLAVAVISTALVTIAYVGMLGISGLLPREALRAAALHFWVGEIIGVTVLTPFLLLVATRRWTLRPTGELLATLVAILAALGIVFGLTDTYRFQLFYLFFLPIVWTAVRFGLEGVSVALVTTQVGLIAAMYFTEPDAGRVAAYQALMAVLALTGLAVGVLVSEQQRTRRQLRINQEALNRALRLSTMGEFAAALAHEINQPLTALANYARLAQEAKSIEAASGTLRRINAQVDRLAEVVRRLRNFIQMGHTEVHVVPVHRLLERALSYCDAELELHNVRAELAIDPGLPDVRVDERQIEQVVVNLVRNSAEALAAAGRPDGRIAIEAVREGKSVAIRVRDNGPGFDPDLLDRASMPFTTTKEDGLGLGLALARSIIEAHGGRLAISSTPGGAVVAFTLPPSANGREGQ